MNIELTVPEVTSSRQGVVPRLQTTRLKGKWRIFSLWCDAVALMLLPTEPENVAMVIGARAKLCLTESTLAYQL